jgi:hypothetical protein
MASPENVCYELFELFEEQSKQDRGAHARLAYMVWITAGFYLYVTSPGVSLFSLSAIGFLILGIFAAYVVMGRGGYLVQRAMAAALEKTVVFPGPITIVAITALCWLLFIGEVAVGYGLARAAFDRFTGN